MSPLLCSHRFQNEGGKTMRDIDHYADVDDLIFGQTETIVSDR